MSVELNRTTKFLVTSGVFALACASSSAVRAQDAEPEQRNNVGLADIVVTAQKREQRLQEVPVSVTALETEALAANRISNVRNLDGIVPNMTIRTVNTGASNPTVTMRGDNTLGVAPGSDKGVPMYLNGVYLGAVSSAFRDVADVQRIEVLRGPQGTLFGRNSTGGAISITTAEPTGEFGVRQDFTYGNFDQFRSRTRIETPQIGPLSAILIYNHNERRGDLRNLGGGTELDFSAVTGGAVGKIASPKYLGNQNSETFAATVKLDATPDVKVVYRYDRDDSTYSPPGIGILGLNPVGLPPQLASLVSAYTSVPNTTPVTVLRPDAVNNVFSAPADNEGYGHTLTIDWAVNDSLSIKNIAAYLKQSNTTRAAQLDGMGGFILPGNTPFFFLPDTSASTDKQFSEELQINYDSDLFTMTAGAVYYEAETNRGGFGSAAVVYQFTAMPGYLLPDRNNLPTEVKIKAMAAYGQVEFHATPRLDLVLGARITRDKKDGIDRQVNGKEFDMAYRDTRPTFNVGVNYTVNSDILTYAKYSTGYISGGQLARLEYRPQTAKSWEAGIKADWLNRRLRTNLSAFYVKYRDLQFSLSGRVAALGVTDPDIAADVNQAAQTLVNQGDARVWGFELETMFQPVETITLGANAGYSNFRFTELNPLVVLAGSTYPQLRPEWTLNLNGQYESPEFGDGMSVLLRMDGNMKGKVFAGNGAPTPEFLAAMTVPTSWIVNGRAALRGIKLGQTELEVAAWVVNLTNDRHVTYAANLNLVMGADYERARTFGLDVSMNF